LFEWSCSLLTVEHLLSLWSHSSSRLDFDSLRGMLSKGNTLCDAITSDGPELACNELLEIWYGSEAEFYDAVKSWSELSLKRLLRIRFWRSFISIISVSRLLGS
jgi:hypothetical protein